MPIPGIRNPKSFCLSNWYIQCNKIPEFNVCIVSCSFTPRFSKTDFSRYSHTTPTYFRLNTIKETHQTILGFLTATWVQVSAPGVQWKPISLFWHQHVQHQSSFDVTRSVLSCTTWQGQHIALRMAYLLRRITILQRIKINTPACFTQQWSFSKVTSRKNAWMKAKQKNQYLSFIAIIIL